MKVLSIDLDYAMHKFIDSYEEWDQHPLVSWEKIKDLSDVDYASIEIDKDSINYMWTTFVKALRNCKNVDFAYDHDSILYRLENYDDIEILNIDQHGDVSNLSEFVCYLDETDEDDPNYAREIEHSSIEKFDDVMEGNWVAWLKVKNKLKKYTLITEDKNYFSDEDISWDILSENNYGGKFKRSEYQFENYNFDYIFICLSPTYVPPKFWKYFKFFIRTYQKLTGREANIINQKYEITARYRNLDKYLMRIET
jgi:hypothetical protein